MLPEGTLLDVVDEADGGEVHVVFPVQIDSGSFGDICRLGRSRNRAFERHGFVFIDRSGELGGTEDVGHEEMVV